MLDKISKTKQGEMEDAFSMVYQSGVEIDITNSNAGNVDLEQCGLKIWKNERQIKRQIVSEF